MKVEPGDFIITGFGPGLVINKYKGDPDSFFGDSPEVIDVVYKNRIIKQMEVASIVKVVNKNIISKNKKLNIIKGIFTKVSIDSLKRV